MLGAVAVDRVSSQPRAGERRGEAKFVSTRIGSSAAGAIVADAGVHSNCGSEHSW